MRALCVALFALALAGCGDKKCTPGTIFVKIDRSGAAANATTLAITYNGSTQNESLAKASVDTSVAIKLPYTAGAMITIDFAVLDASGATIASKSETLTLDKSCTSTEVALGDGTDGAAGGDDGGTFPDGGMVAECTGCFVTNVTPRLAQVGDKVVIDGVFNGTTSVSFPGGATAAMTLDGNNRGTVLVPTGTTAGALSVVSNGITLPAGTFRAASYTLAPVSLDAEYAQLDTARAPTGLMQAHHFETLTFANGWIYAIGGNQQIFNQTGALSTVERVRVNADGTLGYHDVLKATSLNTARMGHSAVVLADKLWVIGGYDGTSTLDSAEWATINADGTLSAFTQVALTPGTGQAEASVSIVGTQLVIVGGWNYTSDVGTVSVASIGSDGMLGTFAASSTKLMPGRHGHAAFVTPTQLVVVGGSVGGTAIGTIFAAPLAGGQVGAFADTKLTLPDTKSSAAITGIQFGNQLLAYPYLGSFASGTGELLAFTNPGIAEHAVTGNHTGQRFVLARDHVYTDTNQTPEVEAFGLLAHMSLVATPGLSTFGYDSSTLPVSQQSGIGAVIGDTAYVLGGQTNAIYSAKIAPDDTLSNFATNGSMNHQRSEYALVVFGNRIYAIGGISAGSPVTTVDWAPINADDTIGTWSASSAVLNIARRGIRASVTSGYLCVFGGYTSGLPYYTDYECTTNGTTDLASFFVVKNSSNATQAMTTAHVWYVAGNHDGSMWVLGGATGGNAASMVTVESNDPEWISTQNYTPWAATELTLDAGRQYSAGLEIGSYWYLLGGLSTNSVVRAQPDSSSAMTFQSAGVSLLANPAPQGAEPFLIGNKVYIVGGGGAQVESATLTDPK